MALSACVPAVIWEAASGACARITLGSPGEGIGSASAIHAGALNRRQAHQMAARPSTGSGEDAKELAPALRIERAFEMQCETFPRLHP